MARYDQYARATRRHRRASRQRHGGSPAVIVRRQHVHRPLRETRAVTAVKRAETQFQLARVCIIKNEASYAEEWIAYHLALGVQHFLFYDKGSTDGLHTVLQSSTWPKRFCARQSSDFGSTSRRPERCVLATYALTTSSTPS